MLTVRNFNVKSISHSIQEIIQGIMLCGFQDMVMVIWENQTRRQGICFQQLEQHSHKYLDLHQTPSDFMKGYKTARPQETNWWKCKQLWRRGISPSTRHSLKVLAAQLTNVFYLKIRHSNTGLLPYNTLLNGPTIHKYLYYTILQFTTWQITFKAATNKVYHELKVHPKTGYCNKFCEENPHMAQ
jgi:hypothetical protein